MAEWSIYVLIVLITMKNFYSTFWLSLLLSSFFTSSALDAQQDPLFSRYKFNALTYNPAYAGSKDHLSLGLQFRRQWAGFEGAPRTFSLSAHSPLRRNQYALGASFTADKVGATTRVDANAVYAYRIKINQDVLLSLGLQAGVTNWHADWFTVTVEQGGDEVFQNNFSIWQPNFGAGAYLYSKDYYIGLSCPRLVEQAYRVAGNEISAIAANYRHFTLAAGMAIPLREGDMIFRPSILLRKAGFGSKLRQSDDKRVGAPTSVDLDAALRFRQKIWVGAGFRSALELAASSTDAVDLWMTFDLDNGMRLGGAYDIILSRLSQVSYGSFELLMGYDFDIKVKRVASPRYF